MALKTDYDNERRKIIMPIIRSMMKNMIKQYGDRAKEVYYATENKLKKKGKMRSMLSAATKHNDTTNKWGT